MALSDLTPPAVRAAIEEFDRLGREAFLLAHGFREARTYFLESAGNLYDSKAIAGVAHGYIGPGFTPLKSSYFSGGEATVKRALEGLGFSVVKQGASSGTPTNPNWTRDELILALDLYLRRGGCPLSRSNPEIVSLSTELNQLNALLGRRGNDTFRNPNGVYMTIANFVHLDPAQRASGRIGIPKGGKEQSAVWDEFSNKPIELHELARTIRRVLELPPSEAPPDYDSDEIEEAPEGKIFTRLHRFRERNRGLVERRKQLTLRLTGKLECEACGFDFAKTYGDRGRGFIEVHHVWPVCELGEDGTTRLEDLALLCANCHRMIHSARPWLDVIKLKELLANGRTVSFDIASA